MLGLPVGLEVGSVVGPAVGSGRKARICASAVGVPVGTAEGSELVLG